MYRRNTLQKRNNELKYLLHIIDVCVCSIKENETTVAKQYTVKDRNSKQQLNDQEFIL